MKYSAKRIIEKIDEAFANNQVKYERKFGKIINSSFTRGEQVLYYGILYATIKINKNRIYKLPAIVIHDDIYGYEEDGFEPYVMRYAGDMYEFFLDCVGEDIDEDTINENYEEYINNYIDFNIDGEVEWLNETDDFKDYCKAIILREYMTDNSTLIYTDEIIKWLGDYVDLFCKCKYNAEYTKDINEWKNYHDC